MAEQERDEKGRFTSMGGRSAEADKASQETDRHPTVDGHKKAWMAHADASKEQSDLGNKDVAKAHREKSDEHFAEMQKLKKGGTPSLKTWAEEKLSNKEPEKPTRAERAKSDRNIARTLRRLYR